MAAYQVQNSLFSVNTKIALFGNKRALPATEIAGVDGFECYYAYAYTKCYANYFKMDLNFNYKRNYKHASLEYFMEIGNITNHQNIWMSYYNKNQQKEKHIYQTGFFPIGGCKVYF